MAKEKSGARRWWVSAGILLALVVCTIVIWAAKNVDWGFFRDGDKVTVTVFNSTRQPVQSIAILTAPSGGRVLATLPDVQPHQKSQATFHFKIDLGTAWICATRPDTEISSPLGCFLTDNGPYEYVVTVQTDQLHIKSYVASHGSSEGDCPLVDSGR